MPSHPDPQTSAPVRPSQLPGPQDATPGRGSVNFLLEEWKANNDLFKYHEDLKQKRFSYCFALQSAMLALSGLLLREALASANLLTLIAGTIFSGIGIQISRLFINTDRRARAYVDAVKGKLLVIESTWRQRDPATSFSTYSEQFSVLVHHDAEVTNRYLAARGLRNDPLQKLLCTGAAYVSETQILKAMKWLWISVTVSSIITLFFHIAKGLR